MNRNNQQETPNTLLYALLGFTVIMLALFAYWVYQFEQAPILAKAEAVTKTSEAMRNTLLPFLFWSGFNAMVGAFAAFSAWMARSPDADTPQVSPMKLLVLTVGGTLGLTTFLFLGLLYPVVSTEWRELVDKGRTAWKDWHAWIPVFAALGGLVVMFVSLLAVRSEERVNPTLRRLIYGYNTFLTGFLLLAIMAVGLVMVHFYGNPTFDWTASNIYSISGESKKILSDLKTPVQIYVVFPGGNPTRADLELMLSSFKAANPKMIDYHSVSPTNLAELPIILQLRQEYGLSLEDSSERDGVAKGVLVVAEKEGEKPVFDFVKRSVIEEIKSRNPMGGGDEDSGRVFKGEQAVMTAIVNLTGGKTNQVLYFTQGNGEPKLDDFKPSRVPGGGLGELKRRLEEKGYVVKELSLVAETGKTPKVPDDAFAVVSVGPENVDAAKVDAIREYAKTPKGKLIILADVNHNAEWKLTPTGLEQFLSEYGIQLTNDVVVNVYSRYVFTAHAAVSPQAERSLADALSNRDRIALVEARDVRTAANNPNSRYLVTPLLEAYKPKDRPLGQWTETNPGVVVGGGQEQLQQYATTKLKENETSNAPSFPLAVTVREKAEQQPNNPHAFMDPDSQGAPKMVVFGDATFAENWGLMEGDPDNYFGMFNAALGWLRGRTDLMQEIKPKIRTSYKLGLTENQTYAMQWYPGFVLLIVIVVCGMGVLLMRRR